MERISRAITGAVVAERVRGMCKFSVPPDSRMQNGSAITLGGLFGTVEALKKNLSVQYYSVAQTSLEQLFLRFARGERVVATSKTR